MLTALIALFSGLVGVLITQFVTGMREARKEMNAARYLAIRLAVLLEGYALSCAEGLSSRDTFVGSRGSAGSDLTRIPDLPEYPDEDGWRALKPELLERALTLRNQVTVSRRAVAAFADVAFGDDAVDRHLAGHTGVCGHVAWTLAKDMRSAYGLEPFDPKKTSWDVGPTLREWHDRILMEQADLQSGLPV